MRLYFGGSEVKMWRDLLAEEQVANVALSYVGLLRRNKGNVQITTDWSISGHYPDYQNIFLDSGAFTLNKEDAQYTKEQAIDLATSYGLFVVGNVDRCSLVSEFDAQILGYDFIKNARETFYNGLPSDKFMPIWHAEYGADELERLCSTYTVVGIPTTDIGDKSLIPLLNTYIHKYGVRLHGVAITGRKLMREVKWDSVASMSWLSPTRFGDTIIWTGNELKRYPRAYKDRARQRHGRYLENHNFDLDKIASEDGKEILRLSLWSWGKFVDSINRVTTTARNEMSDFAETDDSSVDSHDTFRRNEHLLPAIPETSAFELALRGSGDVAKTIEQRKVLLSALIDLQGQRVLELKKREDEEGDFADINLSSEMDRLVRFVKTQNEMERQSFSLKIEASSPATGEGFMSTMFGSNVGEKLIPETKTTAETVLAAAEEDIHEGELVE